MHSSFIALITAINVAVFIVSVIVFVRAYRSKKTVRGDLIIVSDETEGCYMALELNCLATEIQKNKFVTFKVKNVSDNPQKYQSV